MCDTYIHPYVTSITYCAGAKQVAENQSGIVSSPFFFLLFLGGEGGGGFLGLRFRFFKARKQVWAWENNTVKCGKPRMVRGYQKKKKKKKDT